MTVPGYRNAPAQSWDPAAPVDTAEAVEFLERCYHENPRLGPAESRILVVRAQIDATGTYTHTTDELTYGAKLAWRNASRCIGRLYWRSLVVLDRRRSSSAEQIFADLLKHLYLAGGQAAPAELEAAEAGAIDSGRPGVLRPVISIFAPATPGQDHPRIWNEQLIRYAGYRNADGSITGDPRMADFTTSMLQRGWQGSGGRFDVLPLAIETPTEPVQLFTLPPDAVLEVALRHPEHPWFAELGLRWHVVPAIANMRLSVGGLQYPLAPFNGWYMGTEIGSRNLADPHRYDLVPEIGRRLGLDMSSEATLWRDRALVELNRAVLWSFDQAGMKITDHHTESERFLTHLKHEERAGRAVPADWSWIVPPLSGGATGVFHRYYDEADLKPNFYLDESASELAQCGRPADVVTDQARCPVSAGG